MIEAIIYIAIGTFIGWNIPQPEWSKELQTKALSIFETK
jgi:hypothetical protein